MADNDRYKRPQETIDVLLDALKQLRHATHVMASMGDYPVNTVFEHAVQTLKKADARADKVILMYAGKEGKARF